MIGKRKPAVLPEPVNEAEEASGTGLRAGHEIAIRRADGHAVLLNGCRTLVLAADDVLEERVGHIVASKLDNWFRHLATAHLNGDIIVLRLKVRILNIRCRS